MRKPLLPVLAAVLSLSFVDICIAGADEEALAARNPALAELRIQDSEAFAAAAAIIIEHERKSGFNPSGEMPPESGTGARELGTLPGREFTIDNPDILWLYNSSPEGMSDLISILKSAGQKPKN